MVGGLVCASISSTHALAAIPANALVFPVAIITATVLASLCVFAIFIFNNDKDAIVAVAINQDHLAGAPSSEMGRVNDHAGGLFQGCEDEMSSPHITAAKFGGGQES